LSGERLILELHRFIKEIVEAFPPFCHVHEQSVAAIAGRRRCEGPSAHWDPHDAVQQGFLLTIGARHSEVSTDRWKRSIGR